jgi:hypothetical protein
MRDFNAEITDRVAERLYIESVDESDIHSNRLPSWLELDESDRIRWRRLAPLMPHLCDRADGVKGHYAIGRMTPKGYYEYWNTHSCEWAAFAHAPLSLVEARKLRNQLALEVDNEYRKYYR